MSSLAGYTRTYTRVAPRAEQLHFPDDVQAVVCELLCDLRLPTTTDTLARRKLEKYKKEPRKVLKALEARRRGDAAPKSPECALVSWCDSRDHRRGPGRPGRPSRNPDGVLALGYPAH